MALDSIYPTPPSPYLRTHSCGSAYLHMVKPVTNSQRPSDRHRDSSWAQFRYWFLTTKFRNLDVSKIHYGEAGHFCLTGKPGTGQIFPFSGAKIVERPFCPWVPSKGGSHCKAFRRNLLPISLVPSGNLHRWPLSSQRLRAPEEDYKKTLRQRLAQALLGTRAGIY